MKKPMCLAVVISLLFLAPGISFAKKETPQQKIAKIDSMAKETLARLFSENSSAKRTFENAYGYAVFHTAQTAILISAGGGEGVAVNKKTGGRTYMKMGSGGIGLGIGVQLLYTVFFFEDAKRYNDFVDKGWDADASASAAAGTAGSDRQSSFTNGIALYQLTDKGLIAQVSVKGTKYWKDKKLNRYAQK